ncbi:hypothetical protein JST97_18730 [bacterium]|nr:hypothetical protein [bacterium]
MIAPSEYLPHFASFIETHDRYRKEQIGEPDFRVQASAFASHLQQLQQRLNWELPLLAGFSEAPQAIEMLVEPLNALTHWVEQSPQEEAVIGKIRQCQQALGRISYLFRQLPDFVDVTVINELLILASPEGGIDPEPVRQRLPFLLSWLRDLEAGWRLFGFLYPHRQSLVGKALLLVEGLKEAAGGIYLYLQGEDPGALRTSLKRTLKGLMALAPLHETRQLEEVESLRQFSDPCLERGARLLTRLGRLPPPYHRELHTWFQVNLRSLAELNSRLLLSGAERPEVEAQLSGLEEELHGLLRYDSNSFELDQFPLLQKLEDWKHGLHSLEDNFPNS